MRYLTFTTKNSAEAAQNTIYLEHMDSVKNEKYKLSTSVWAVPIKAEGESFWIIPHPENKLPDIVVTKAMGKIPQHTIRQKQDTWFLSKSGLV